MSDARRHAEFLARRLRAMGVAADLAPGATSAQGVLELSPEPFATQEAPLRFTSAGFYTLGHSRLKFCQPRVLFDLPALEVGSCRTQHEIQQALRRAWQRAQDDLGLARHWLQRLGSDVEISRQGTRVRLIPQAEARTRWEVRSPDEIQLPSVGPLAERSARDPGERRLRPPRGLEHSSELDQALDAALLALPTSHAGGAASTREVAAPAPPRARVLLLANDAALIAQLEHELPALRIALDTQRDPHTALAAFHLQSFDAVLVESRLSRSDGLEVALGVREIPGVEDLPVALVDFRDSAAQRAAAEQVGVLRYVVKPLARADIAALMGDMLERVTRRRFRRFALRLAVRAGTGADEDRTEQVARGGFCLRTRSAPALGAGQSYSIAVPCSGGPIRAHGRVVTRVNAAGSASVLTGVRITGFEGDGERRWIDLIERLALDQAEKAGDD